MIQKNYSIKSSIIILFIFVMFFIFQDFSLAQSSSGRIQGTVRDSTTNEALVGANIVIAGTSLGAATDLDGRYLINQVPAGTHQVIVSYIGYVKREFTVVIQGNKTLQLDFTLVSQVLEGEEIIITAQAQGQKAAINQQLTSNTIINVISAEKIRQLPDDNAATALSRLPGVSLMNGDQVVIRGVEAKLNQVLINGIQMPSTDMENRSTNLGFISSNMLSGIEVIKAITPDMDANTVGGVVNLRLASAKSGLHFDFMAQGNYNSSDRTVNTYKMWGSVSNRFFDDALGVFVQANADRTDGGNQSATNILAGPDGSGSDVYGQGVYLTNTTNFTYDSDIVDNRGGSIVLDYKLPNGKIIMQNTYAATLTDQRHNTIALGYNNTQISYTINRNKYGKELWINSLQVENSFGDFKVEASLSHSQTSQFTRIAYDAGNWITFTNGSLLQEPFGRNPDGSRIIYTAPSQRMNMPLSRAYGIFDNMNPADADSARLSGWPGAMSQDFKQHLYNASLDVSVPVSFSSDINATFKAGGKFIRATRQNNFDRYFAGQDPYAAVHTYFGTGQNQIDNAHALRFNFVRDYDFTRGKYFLSDEYDFKSANPFQYVLNTDIYDPFLAKAITGWTVPFRKDQTFKDDWNGAETFTAGYLMGTFNILDNITLLGGVRLESYNMQYHAQYTFVSHSVDGDCISTRVGTLINLPDDSPYINIPWSTPDPLYNHHAIGYSLNNVNRTDNNVFPGAQIKYKINDWSDLRVAYTTGISRPDYLAILPKVAIYPFANIEMGNPKLRPTTVKNIDVIASIYSNKMGLFTINGFYKQLTDVIYNTAIYYSESPKYATDVAIPDSAFLWNHFNYAFNKTDQIQVNLNNPNTAYVRGVEINWQTNFWYLPKPFDALVLDVNYAKSSSNLDYRILTPIAVKTRDERGRIITTYTTRDTTFNGRLVQNANDVLNVALGIDYEGFSGRISFNMRGNVMNSVGNRPEETSYTGNIYRWDFTLRQNLPLDGLSVSLNGVNIFHNAVRSYRKYRMNPDAPITENLERVLYGPTLFQLNLRYTF